MKIPHPGELRQLVEIGRTVHEINENGFPVETEQVVCQVWAKAEDGDSRYFTSSDVENTAARRAFGGLFLQSIKEAAMITCTLRDKKYSIDFVSGRALRELEPAAQMYAKVVRLSELAAKGQTIPEDAKFTISEAMDTMIRWFCILFQNQFSPDDVLDNYPVDRLMHDIALALMAVQAQTTDVLSDFPTTAATEPAQTPES